MATCTNCGREFDPPKGNKQKQSCSKRCGQELSKQSAKKARRPDTTEKRDKLARERHRAAVRKRGYRMGGSVGELQAIAAASTVAVTKCPPGAHKGWKPSWMP